MSDADLIRRSFALIAADSNAVVLLFYGRLFELNPGARSMFRGDLRTQAAKLSATLDVLVGNAGTLDAIAGDLREMGRRHETYGVRPEHYDLLRQALLWALGMALQEDFDGPTRAAWDRLLVAAAQVMTGAA